MSSNYRTVTLNSDRRGHFQVDARVDGRSIDFLVDTGASSIALRESSRRQARHPSVGARLHHQDADRQRRRQGRAGQLDRVELGGITVRDVEALVVPDEALSTNLLGMTFLSRVKWSHDRGRLVLEQ